MDSSVTNATYVPSPRRGQLPPGPVYPGPRAPDYDLSAMEDRANHAEEENRRLAD
jgi:hypothetical protein